MADIYLNGKRINNVTHIGYDPGSPDGDHTSITVREPTGNFILIDEAENLTDRQIRKLNRKIERGKYIGKDNLVGRLRYRWAKQRGRVQGDFYWVNKK